MNHDIKQRLELKFAELYGLTLNPETNRWDSVANVNISNMGLHKFPIRFGKINGHFSCAHNKLVSLSGGPTEAYNYLCNGNMLTNLDGIAKIIKGSLWCSYNQLTSLEGMPDNVDLLDCANNELTNLNGIAKTIKSNFYCEDNKLTSLNGLQSIIKGDFWCHYNKLTSLDVLEAVTGNIRYTDNEKDLSQDAEKLAGLF